MTARNETPIIDKLDTHHRQQLSALMDGDLPADEARFLLRRLQHDRDLTGCWERWQLCGDVLRGQGRAPAPAGFAERVMQAVAAESATPSVSQAPASRPRNLLARWGGGALAASVALVALFMARQQSPQEVPVSEGTQVASAQSVPPAKAPETPAPDAEAYAVAAMAAVASVPRRQDKARRNATRTQQAARSAQRVARANAPVRAAGSSSGTPVAPANALVAAAPSHATGPNPFSHQAQEAGGVVSRPWPRSALSGYPSASGALTTGYSADSAARTFYPFAPQLPSVPPVALPADAPRE
ncbi:sigma-E factor negative regulatory protein [Pseudoxanthomonas sp.]|uniref:sigma-E factor negative regulatory protein n=1 Tax=Pseudoxanthomonas sp. TaxID=1871049 RepID=UPI002FE160FC